MDNQIVTVQDLSMVKNYKPKFMLNEYGLTVDQFDKYYPDIAQPDFHINPIRKAGVSVTAGDLVEIVLQTDSSHSGTEIANMVFHYLVTEIANNQTFAQWVTSMASAMKAIIGVAGFLNLFNTGRTFERILAFNLNQPTESAQAAIGEDGTATGDPSPARASPVVALNTANRGRSYHGRKYLPPIVEADKDGSNISTGALTILKAFADSMLTLGSGGNSGRQAVYSKTLSTPTNVVGTPITGTRVNSRLGSQRRRLRTIT